jgi:hypothetical protein
MLLHYVGFKRSVHGFIDFENININISTFTSKSDT